MKNEYNYRVEYFIMAAKIPFLVRNDGELFLLPKSMIITVIINLNDKEKEIQNAMCVLSS